MSEDVVLYDCTWKHQQLGTLHTITIAVPKYHPQDQLMSWEEGYAWRAGEKVIESMNDQPAMELRLLTRMSIHRRHEED